MGLAISLIHYGSSAMVLLIMFYVIILWVTQGDWGHPIAVGIGRVVRPLLAPFRPLVPASGFDISPILAIFTILAVAGLLTQLLSAIQAVVTPAPGF